MFIDIVAIVVVYLSFGISTLFFGGATFACWKGITKHAFISALAGAVIASLGIITSQNELSGAKFLDSNLLIPWKDFLRLNDLIGMYLIVANLLAMFAAIANQKSPFDLTGE